MAIDPYGGGYGANPQRDMIAQVLAQQANPPPGNGAPGIPNNLSAMPDMTPMPGMQALGQGQQGQGGVASPQAQPGYGMPGVGAPLPGAMALPGIMQPGQLPMGMNPQAVAGGAPPLPMPPRY
jgi:hypothetical protein